jgi:hypothetical protein
MRAIEIARSVMAGADLLLAITDAEHDWPDLPRAPDVRLAGKADLASRPDGDLAVSATTGAGLRELTCLVRERLVPSADVEDPRPWWFDPRLAGDGGEDR